MTSPDKPSKLRFARYGFMGASTCFTLASLLLSMLRTTSTGLRVTTAAGTVATVVYIPAALFIALRKVDSTFDHAAGEVAFLSVLSAIWSASSITAGITGGPGICHSTLYGSGRLADSFPKYRIEINRIARECDTLRILTVLSVVHTVLVLTWIALDVYLVYSAAKSGSGMTRSDGFKLPMWKLSRGEYAQVHTTDMYETAGSARAPPMATPMKGGFGHSGYAIPGYAQYHTPQGKSPVNPFGSTYEVDNTDPFDNPFERTPTRSSRRG